MKRALIALAAAAAISPTAFAGDVSWGGDANVEGYMSHQQNSADVTTKDDRGYTNRIRLKGTFKADGNVSVSTRIILADGAFTGDDYAAGTYRNNSGDTVSLDYGYIQAPIAGWTFRLGRQTANWANCFVTCDDRRDRLLTMKRFGGTTVILINDKRASTGDDETTATGEGDMYAAAAVGVVSGWQWGFLVAKWLGEPGYALQDVWEVSPTIKGKFGNFKVEGALDILGGGNKANNAYFTETAVSAYVRGSLEVSSVNVEAQVVVGADGGLVPSGFDSFSILLGNNPDNDQSSTMVDSIGSYGTIGNGNKAIANDEWLVGLRASGKAGKFGWKASTAYFSVQDTVPNATTVDYTIATIDGGVTYAVAKTTELYLNTAVGVKSDDLTNAGDVDYRAATVGITTTF